MVWQDFQFACGVYPAHDSFVATVKAEVEDNVKRLRHHASMTVFCGNNEGSCGLIFSVEAFADYCMQIIRWCSNGEVRGITLLHT